MPAFVRRWFDCASRWSTDACRWGELFVLALGTFFMVSAILYMANRADLLRRQVEDNYRALIRLRDYTLDRDAKWEQYVRDRDAKWEAFIRSIPVVGPPPAPSPSLAPDRTP